MILNRRYYCDIVINYKEVIIIDDVSSLQDEDSIW